MKIPTINNPINARSDSGIEAAKLLAELSQKDGVSICSEYYSSSNDQEKAFLIEDLTNNCKVAGLISAAELSLKSSCVIPSTGSQSLSKSGDKNYRRSSVYISGATSDQLKILANGWSDLSIEESGAEVKRTENLR